MGVSFEQAEKNLDELVKWHTNNSEGFERNEATTRVQLIDRLFFECLGWGPEDCLCEERTDVGYIDYCFRCPEALLIVEAKKEGVYFEIPAGTTGLKYNINYFSRHAPNVADAIRQAIGYCQSHGTPFGAVCNGQQLVAFIASRTDGSPPLEGKALVFASLKALRSDFLRAWQCLSKPGIMSRQLAIELQDTVAAPVPDKLSARISGYPGWKRRNALQTDLQILADLFIEDVAVLSGGGDEGEFLRQCYCNSGALSQYATVSKEILRTRYSALFQTEAQAPTITPIQTKKGLNPEFVARALSRRPILLIGDRGVGKTTFVKHLYKVEATAIFSNAVVLYIDFGSKPTLVRDVGPFVAQEIAQQLSVNYDIDIFERNFVTGVLHRDLQQFERGIYANLRATSPDAFEAKRVEFMESKLRNQDDYLDQCLNHISKGQRKQVVVFLDNVDQRPDDYQDAVFLVGQTMAVNWPVTVYISLRPETFYRSKVSGTLSAYHPRAFTIAPPRVDEVVAKRLNYGISLLERGGSLGLGEDVTVRTENLHDYLVVLVRSFSTSKWLVEFLDNVCGGNIRLALEFVRAFIGSGHVDSGKILTLYRTQGNYTVPLHEFLRAIIYADHEHYSPAASQIVNLFDISAPDGREHFLSPVLLSQMHSWSQQSPTEGFVHESVIHAYMQSLGFVPNQINSALQRLAGRNLIETPSRAPEEQHKTGTSNYRVTSVGVYYVQQLVRRFVYIDAMTVDTPIVDPARRREIAEVYALHDRLDRARVFCAYLDAQWQGVAQRDLAFDWRSVRAAIDRDIEYITGRVSLREDVIEGSS